MYVKEGVIDYLNMDSNLFYSIINMKLRDFYSNIEDLCLSENLEQDKIEDKIKSSGFMYDSSLNKLIIE